MFSSEINYKSMITPARIYIDYRVFCILINTCTHNCKAYHKHVSSVRKDLYRYIFDYILTRN